MIQVTPQIALSEDEIEESFIRSPGPGGQNVNKVETAVQLRFDARRSPAISPALFHRLRRLAGSRMTQDGVLIITAYTHRQQMRNREEALARLVDLIRRASVVPKRRRPTKPTRGSQKRRLESKKNRGALKKMRAKTDISG